MLNRNRATAPVQQTAVRSRLQSLFPPTPVQTQPPAPLDKALPPLPPKPSSAPCRSLKVRVLTWNMHDSVPKGDLEELLGKVPLWTPSSASSTGFIPNFPPEPGHPYHLVIVAGQECPSLSGIPMGLGAGFKLIDKDRDRDREKDKDRDRESFQSRPRHSHSLTHSHKDSESHSRTRKSPDEHPHPHDAPSGWTSMIEDWYCQGSGSNPASRSPTVADIGFPKPLSSRPAPPKEPRKGPYTLLVKERMMGIYLAVFVHRDVRPLVKGTSRSVVTAGLIGGRVGNKGGVGITMNLDGTTFLFLNAHLAAHEGKVNHRLSNLAKIKNELSVDDFLSNDDPRVMAEDLTDKFDYTFLFGDLNFRLDISRLHADWLMSRKEYAQALAFDQLTKLMYSGEAFVGFKESTIDFPPTFKYDVLRTLKHAKRRGSKLDRWRHPGERSHRLTEVEEKELEELEKKEAESDADAEGEGEEGASMASSMWTSAHSRVTDRDLEDDEFFTSPSSQTMATTSSTKVSGSASIVAVAAHRAKAKWLSLLSSSRAKSPLHGKHADSYSPGARKAPHSTTDIPSHGLLTPVSTPERPSRSSLEPLPAPHPPSPPDKTRLRPPPMILVNSTKSSIPSDDDVPDAESPEKGVYDSSHKKRVPSWCDRILWKSTVLPDPEPEPEPEPEEQPRSRMRVGQFFVNAFRPLSSRVRKDSLTSAETSRTSDSFEDPQSSPDVLDDAVPISRFTQQPQSPQHQRHLDRPPQHPHRNHTHPEVGLRRTSSAIPSPSPSPGPGPEPPHRRMTASGATPPALSLQYPHPNQYTPQPLPSTSSSRWRFFPSFFSHTAGQMSSTSIEQPSIPDPPTPPPPKKGDVVCLSYHTLDDRGMRRLEGRSDHRPVIGTYAVYI